MTDDEAWRTEERFWTGGQDHYNEALDPECIMAFPAPAGIIQGPGIAESLVGTPRWASVEMAERHVGRPAADLLVLAYRARGLRDGAPPYEAYCTSTYRRAGAGWRLVQHQQTPARSAVAALGDRRTGQAPPAAVRTTDALHRPCAAATAWVADRGERGRRKLAEQVARGTGRTHGREEEDLWPSSHARPVVEW